MVLAVIIDHQLPIKLDQAVVVDLEANKEFQENHGVTDKDTVITAAESTVVVVVVVVHHTVAASAARVLFDLYGAQAVTTQITQVNTKRNTRRFLNVIYICRRRWRTKWSSIN